MGIWVLSSLAITNKSAMNIMYKSLHEHMLYFFFGKYLGVEWQGHMLRVYFPEWLYNFTFFTISI